MVQSVRRTVEISQLLVKVIDAPVLLFVRVPHVVIIPVVTLRLIPMVSWTMEIPQLFLDEVVDVLLEGGASSTGAVVEKVVVLPQLHLLRNSLQAAHELRWESEPPPPIPPLRVTIPLPATNWAISVRTPFYSSSDCGR